MGKPKARKPTTRRGRIVGRRMRVRAKRTQSQSLGSSFIGYMRLARIALATLPIPETKNLLGLFDVVFNFIKVVLEKVDYYTGAYAAFGISPAALIANSPLLAKDGTRFSFPGYPVSLKWIHIKLRNTTVNSERSGRWAAVMIPYRELHDANHYTKLQTFTFSEVAAMPYARTAPARDDIDLHFKMRDKTMYCAQPRELTEEIAFVFVIWDTTARDNLKGELHNSEFGCEVELSAGCLPHAMFGPQHRVAISPDALKIHSVTDGTKVRVHEDGDIRFEDYVHTDWVQCDMSE